ncbi:MAG: ImmA/IrrE family metallo-endopeptidase [Planctomycetia bacterium]|nr:ImmA/IrrE family metallo-endopeptidase [Planctomycetia bacterium]
MRPVLEYRYFEPRWGSRQVDRRAWECLEQCRKQRKMESLPLPIPVEEWIEGPLRVRLGFGNLSRFGADVLGAAYPTKREIMIDEQVLSHEGRCRFTAAHELGHIILHAKAARTFRDTLDYGLSTRDQFEREANRFAAAFLMPLALLERELLQLCDSQGMKRSQCFAELMEPIDDSESLWRRRFLPTLARKFKVSKAAAVIRCSDIQPRIARAQPLLPRKLVQKLIEPEPDRQPMLEFADEGSTKR